MAMVNSPKVLPLYGLIAGCVIGDTAVYNLYLTRNAAGKLFVMRYHQQRFALLFDQLEKEIEYLGGRSRIKIAGRFISNS